MFLQVSVCHSVQGAPHVTITHDALDLTVQAPTPPPQDIRRGTPLQTSDLRPLGVISGGQH